MEQRHCQRGYSTQRGTVCERVIPTGEIYRIVGGQLTRHCKDCAAEVLGPRWALDEYAMICKDNYQISRETIRMWAAAADAYLAAAAA